MKNLNWLPNSVTLLNLILGFYAIILVFRDQFVTAAFLIFLSMILDGLDGRLARRVTTDNPMGEDLDSLADMISFGVTPALLIYQMHLTGYGVLGVIVAAAFPVCGAVRLARFNALDSGISSDYFTGLPITAGGGFLISLVLAQTAIPSVAYLVIGPLIAYLMVSRIKYPNFKKVTSFQIRFMVIFFGICFALAFSKPSAMLMNMMVGYVSLGLALHLAPAPKLTKLFYTA